MYLPGFPAIARDLRTDISQVGLTLTSYFIGLSMGQLMLGPVLDRYGRKRPLMLGLLVYILAAVGCTFSPSIHYLIGLRLFLAIGCCVGMVGGSSVIRDLFSGREVARALSMMMTIFGVAPIIAPTIGGLIVTNLGWRYIFGVLSVIGAFVLVAIKKVIPETKGSDPSISLRPKNVMLGYFDVFKERQFVIYVFAGAASSGGLFSYITGIPFVYINLFGFTATQFGWIFGMNALAIVVGNLVNRELLRKYDSAQILPMVTALQSATGILLLIGSVMGFLPKMAFLCLMALFLFCFGFMNPNSLALMLQPFSKNVGSASAIMGGTLMISGALASGLVSSLHNGTAFPMTMMMAIYPSAGFILTTIGLRFIRMHHRSAHQ
jgi:DHA1 family bicyclomycin/chloramphenicol resistance-like MFS transporter